MSDKEKAEIATSDATAVGTLYNDGIINRAIALKELRQNSSLTGRFTNISDDDIKEAEDEPERVPGEEDIDGLIESLKKPPREGAEV
jgi:hypothetical protein